MKLLVLRSGRIFFISARLPKIEDLALFLNNTNPYWFRKFNIYSFEKYIKNIEEKNKKESMEKVWLSAYPIMLQTGNFISIDEFFSNTSIDNRSTDEIAKELQEIENQFKAGEKNGVI